MFRTQQSLPPTSRSGVVLLVVIALLTLFAVVGLSFVLYAESAATSAQLYRESELGNGNQGLPTQSTCLQMFLGQMLTDAADDESGVYSALRGHGFARSMYGWNDAEANIIPFNGTGRLHISLFPGPNPALPPAWVAYAQQPPFNGTVPPEVHDEYFMVNYTAFRGAKAGGSGYSAGPLTDGFVRDPERYGARTITNPNNPDMSNLSLRRPFTGGYNVSYTYPDANNMFLAAVQADGTVLMPSFFRAYPATDIGNVQKGFGLLDPNNPNWNTPWGKYLILRPRPAEMGPGFPYPEDLGGDVKNLPGSPGTLVNTPGGVVRANNDSIWLDLDAPVITLPNGKKVKPLFAPLIMDLDNRVNLNVHGNIRGAGNSHASNQGIGPWEVNLSKVLTYTGGGPTPTEWANLFGGGTPFSSALQPPQGRYGQDRQPSANGSSATPPGQPHSYAPLDFDGTATAQYTLPTGTRIAPLFPTPGYDSYPTATAETPNHPLLNNVFWNPGNDDRYLSLSNMEAILRFGDKGAPQPTTDVFNLIPNNLIDLNTPLAATRRRGLVTTYSNDVDRPGVTPHIYDPTASPYTLQTNASFPTGQQLTFPTAAPPATGSEFGNYFRADGSLIQQVLSRIDLNRSLPDYPPIDATTKKITDTVGYQVAQRARQQLARDVFDRLRAVTGAGNPFGATPLNAQQIDALRYLAQLAVNIVDYIDADDYMTAFNWNSSTELVVGGSPATSTTPDWVFGFELPRLVINEVYAEIANDPNDANAAATPPKKATLGFKMNFWVELYNPLTKDATLTESGDARLYPPNSPTAPVYQILVGAENDPKLTAANNTVGDLTAGNTLLQVDNFSSPTPPTTFDPSIVQAQTGAATPGIGYYVLASTYDPEGTTNTIPTTLKLFATPPAGQVPGKGLSYDYAVGPAPQPPPQAVYLRRLACPHMPPQSTNPNQSDYNPYVTVDYMENVIVNNAIRADTNTPNVGGTLPNSYTLPVNRMAYGRNQPYAAHKSQAAAQASGLGPKQTMTAANDNKLANFDWLVHLDRQLINIMELLHVSGGKPFQTTQRFITGNAAPNNKFGHYAPWFDRDPFTGTVLTNMTPAQSARLYRALELLETRNRTAAFAPWTMTVPTPQAAGAAIITNVPIHGFNAGGTPWHIQRGDVLVIEPGTPSSENVRVEAVNVGTGQQPNFQVTFLRTHGSGMQPNFNIALTTTSDRTPGKININTIWDQETMQALADAQPGNNFTDQNAIDVFRQRFLKNGGITTYRTEGAVYNSALAPIPGPRDQPFLGLATGTTTATGNDPLFPRGSGVNSTILRGDGVSTTGLFFDPNSANAANTHPYQQYSMLTKLFNNVTTRSNTFAVWLTVGFFEVTDESTRPVKLGAEYGRATNNNTRYRMFAIVDRTNLMVASNNPNMTGVPIDVANIGTNIGAGSAPVQVPVTALSGTVSFATPYPGLRWPWEIRSGNAPGSMIVIERDTPQEEMVQVLAVNNYTSPPTITAVFAKNHAPGAKISMYLVPGNPGPQRTFDLQSNTAVVPYYNVIQ